MKATILAGTRDIRLVDRPDPTILAPGDVVVRVVAACVCGSDLWGYRDAGTSGRERLMGHELVGIVEARGDDVTALEVGDFVIAPFSLSDGTCQSCLAGSTSVCDHVTFFGGRDENGLHVDAGQGELVRIPIGRELARRRARPGGRCARAAPARPVGRRVDGAPRGGLGARRPRRRRRRGGRRCGRAVGRARRVPARGISRSSR